MDIENCDPIKLLNGFANSILPEDTYVHLDVDNFKNPLKQTRFAEEGKFHFQKAIELKYKSYFPYTLNSFIDEIRQNILPSDEKCFENIIKQIFIWFEDEFEVENFKRILFYTQCGNLLIEDEKIVYLLLEFVYSSPALSVEYSFDKMDIRRQTFHTK